jgi:hypothetical protein
MADVRGGITAWGPAIVLQGCRDSAQLEAAEAKAKAKAEAE